jgi:predicted outer membrane protein
MLRSIPRLLRRAVIVAVILAVSASVYQSWASGSPGTAGWTQTQWGPLGPADRDLLVKVRLAGLWEQPTGQQAETQASSPEVQEAGRQIAAEHGTLDAEVRKVADQLGVLLPSSPNASQVAWMNEISQQTGSDYDRVFIQRLREAHGMVLPVIAEVRANTRNELMRQFAETADQFVSRHMGYLEKTGMVDFAALPQPSPGLLAGGTQTGDLVVPILVFVAALLAAIAAFAAVRSRNAARRSRVTVPQRSPAPAAAPLPEFTAVAAIPGPRLHTHVDAAVGAGLESYTSAYATGSTRSASDTGPHRAVSETGSHRWVSDSGSRRTVSDSGSRRAVSDTGSQRAVSDTGSHKTVSDTGSQRAVSDTGSRRAVSDTGSDKTVSDTESQRAVSDTGSHRAVSDSGSHRLGGRSRSRHSLRR